MTVEIVPIDIRALTFSVLGPSLRGERPQLPVLVRELMNALGGDPDQLPGVAHA